ncbi:nucleotidyl transferase AbiEii/AbiGii toxin family protein [Wenzhouxiangella sp. AB-CW3]|uniref:nucleotidyl transferase AbiEii/AbiGii toxin family protein n=1 Tax=Wenzhouxiangella sp. AB-CW3 TaxID=2771012 RepID=UPI00168AD2F6|nr:nucleotidyl transferase AbiEii/AbiGii toxin family protein [Wenzhouxiangella sp. AB-CW3]QOC22894.1 nucleotidyl transferase AbiEii/AbiGii toxin family protein [Wenzhouxiangella sp. AB-CW3]
MTANIAASVRQRLLNLARDQGRPFQEVLQFYVMERFLYRLSQSAHADRFVLKGALMLQVWESPEARPTMDIDMLGRTDNDLDVLLGQVREIMDADLEVDDGLTFHGDSLEAEVITEDAEYEGVRIRGWAELDRARARVQVDIGFGDAVVPEPQRQSYPVLLGQPAPELLCYSRESTIAEKFQAMVALGAINSRMKDFYDIWLLSRQFNFEAAPLLRAITATFERRDTQVPRAPLFEDDFAQEKQGQWRGFLRRLGDEVPAEPDFANVLAELKDFIGTVLAVDADEATALHWPAGGPWNRRDRG